ncbi:MAG: hypothetical protein ACRC8P_01895 [Spiroplasma sp.]
MNKWKDKWFYFKITSAFLTLGGLVAVYLYHMIFQTWIRELDYPFNFFLFQGQFLSFFTFQSNFITGVWFLIAAIYHKQKNRFIENPNILLAITSYISVTFLVFLAILVPGFFISKIKIEIEDIITAPFFHILTPILMISYSLIHIKEISFYSKRYYPKIFFIYLIYPWVYSIYLILRIVVYTNISSLKDIPFSIVYPYIPIFKTSSEVRDDILNGKLDILILIVLFFLVVHCLFVILNFIYFLIFKKITKRK